MNNTKIVFPSDNGVYLIGDCWYKGFIRVGFSCFVLIGSRVSYTSHAQIFTAEGSFIVIGDDTMIATGVNVRSEDAHAIYNVESGKRLNPSRNIIIGQHVWLADKVTVLSDTVIGEGSVVGTCAVTKGYFSNNCLLVGIPAKEVKRDIAWERPHVALTKPYMKTNAITQDLIVNKDYWNKTNRKNKKVDIGPSSRYLLNKYKLHLLKFDISSHIEGF